MQSGLVLTFCALLLAGCAQLAALKRPSADAAPAAMTPDAETMRPQARPARDATAALGRAALTPDQLDQTTQAERAAATAPPAARTQLLGETLAGLGSPTEPGFWLTTGLVTRVTQGRVETANGAQSVRVELRPSGAQAGAGSQMSLAAFRALDLPLTQLVTLRVFAE